MTVRKADSWGFVVIWEFPRMKQRFLRSYGPDGEWATLLSRGKQYLVTELIQCAGAPRTYLTLDFWFHRRPTAFRNSHAGEYKKMDANF